MAAGSSTRTVSDGSDDFDQHMIAAQRECGFVWRNRFLWWSVDH
jgi:hypothetical protein